MRPDRSLVLLASGSLLLVGTSAAYATLANREHFASLFAMVAAAFLGLILLSRANVAGKWVWMAGLLLAMRLPLFLSAPVLSDDYYRFLWDGRLCALGENPYSSLPELLPPELKDQIDGSGELLDNMNSPRYYSVYPPFQQAIFAGISMFGGANAGIEILLTRLLFVLADLVSLWLLMRLIALRNGNTSHAMWYALNPLVVWEGVGNLHFEVVSVPLVLGAIFLYFRYNKPWTAAFLFALGASFKLRPLMLSALGTRYPGTWLYAILGALLVLAPFAFFSVVSLENFRESLALYSGSFEFNASLYYVLRDAGKTLLGYNPIAILGPAMQMLALAAMVIVSLGLRKSEMSPVLGRAVAIYAIYFLCATTVHPWYLIVPLALSLAAGKWWMSLWSFAVFLSYSHYAGGGFKEKYEWIALEYLLVAGAFWLENIGVKFRPLQAGGQ